MIFNGVLSNKPYSILKHVDGFMSLFGKGKHLQQAKPESVGYFDLHP